MDDTGAQRGDAARVRRHHVPAEPARRHSGAGRRNGRLDLGVPARSRQTRRRPLHAAAAESRPTSPASRSGPPPQAAIRAAGSRETSPSIGDRIFGTTNDAHIVALDARTGKLVWDTTVADSKLGYEYTSGPIVVRGKVIAGITGCSRYKEDVCFITGHDAATGKELWRTSTIARPGEPGGDTWGDLPLAFRAGSDAWISGSYDPDTNLVYWGTAQAKPWARAVRGTDGDALYTNSTLALDPDTGKMKWYYQHLPGETQDMDEVFESMLIDIGGRKSLFKMGKLGILWQLDRTTGAFIQATDLGYQNIVRVEPHTGKVTYRPGQDPADRRRGRHVPEHLGIQELARDGIQPADQRRVHPAQAELRESHVRPGQTKVARRRRRRSGAAERLQASAFGRQPGRIPGHGCPVR